MIDDGDSCWVFALWISFDFSCWPLMMMKVVTFILLRFSVEALGRPELKRL